MARPLIGITTSLTEPSQTLQRRYVDAIEQTGGAPVIVAQTADPTAQRPLLEVLDGLVITGGPGITEGLVGRLPDDLPAVDLHRWKSDCVAFELLREKRRPMLGICYGMQFINARLGGTLFADVQAQLQLQRDGLYLYRSMLPVSVPGIAFLGSEVSTFNNVLTHGLQALSLSKLFTGAKALPSPREMQKAVEAEMHWKRTWMPATSARAAATAACTSIES